MTSNERILVMGIGNPLMRDEGVGVRVVELLMSRYEWPDSVEVVDAGTMGLGIINLFRDIDFVLVVDAVDGTGHAPGTILRLSPDDLAGNQVMHSLHDIRFINVLEAAAMSGITPEAECVGIQIERIEAWVTDLSESVESMLDAAVSAVLDVLAEHGVTPTPRTETSVEADIIQRVRSAE